MFTTENVDQTVSGATERAEAAKTTGPLYCAEQIRIPPELPDILKDYAKHMIRTQPQNLIAASAEYFARRVQVGDARELLGATTATAQSFVNNSSLEAFYSQFANSAEFRKAPVYTDQGTQVPKAAVTASALAAGVSQRQLDDVLVLGGWEHAETVSWLQMWALLIATSAGSIFETVKLAVEILADNGKVATAPLYTVFNYLADRDADIQKESERIKRVNEHLQSHAPLCNASELISFLQQHAQAAPSISASSS